MTARSHALRNTVFSSIGIYTEYFLGMVAAILIARHLGPQGYGIYSLLIWFAAIGLVTTNSGVTTGVIKFVAELRGSNREDLVVPLLHYLRRVQRWHLLVVLGLATVGFLLAGERYADDLGQLEFVLLLVAVATRAPYMFNIAIAKGFEAFDATAKVSMVAAPLNLLLVIAAMLMQAPLRWFVVVYAMSGLVFLLASQYFAGRLVRGLPRQPALPDALLQRVRRHLRIVSVTIIISFVIASDVEILFLNLYATAAEAGYFKVAYQLATGVILLVPGVFGAVLLPMMAKALSQGREVAGRRFVAATSYLVLLSAPVVAFGVCFAGVVIALLYGEAYATAAPVFAVLIVAAAISTAMQGASSLLVSADRQHTILLLTVIFGVLKIGLDLVLVRQFGLRGAVAAIVAITVISATVYVLVGMRVSGTRLEWARLRNIVLAALGASALALPLVRLPLAPFWVLLLGGLVLTGAYALLSVVLRCWSSDDLEQLQGLHQRFAGGHPRQLGRLLAWAEMRAQRHT